MDAPEAFDLSRFAPPKGVRVTLRAGQSFTFPGDPDVDDVGIMLRLESAIEDAEGQELATALEEGKATIKRLILAADPGQDVSSLRIGSEEMLMLFALLVHGESVAAAVGLSLSAHNLGLEKRDDETEEDFAERLARQAVEVGSEPRPLSPSASS